MSFHSLSPFPFRSFFVVAAAFLTAGQLRRRPAVEKRQGCPASQKKKSGKRQRNTKKGGRYKPCFFSAIAFTHSTEMHFFWCHPFCDM